MVDLYRVDFIVPIGDSERTKQFPSAFPHLINPLHSGLFHSRGDGKSAAAVLDIQNQLLTLHQRHELADLKKRKLRLYNWSSDDPLSDPFLMFFGGFPEDAIGKEYLDVATSALEADSFDLSVRTKVPASVLDHPGLAYLARHRLGQHSSLRVAWSHAGIYLGEASSFDDLVHYWNLRAADIPLMFVDVAHIPRFGNVLPKWIKLVVENFQSSYDREPTVAVWTSQKIKTDLQKLLPGVTRLHCRVDNPLWNGMNLKVPMMSLGETSTLATVSQERDRTRLSFELPNKPCDQFHIFWDQRFVASLSFGFGLTENEQVTVRPPYVPELNEFISREMCFSYDTLRSEPRGLGMIIHASSSDAIIYALPVSSIFKEVLALAGFKSGPSNAGLIANQLLARLGGLQGARVLKIPGVRRLLRAHGPQSSFTKSSALQMIGGAGSKGTQTPFSEFEGLYIEYRPDHGPLQKSDVFRYTVEKGLFRIGADLICPDCRLGSWIPLDQLTQQVTCGLCGKSYDATRQLLTEAWAYRRSGVLGLEKNNQGAVPVALTLQQLDTNISMHEGMYSTSLNISEQRQKLEFEIDFMWLSPRQGNDKPGLIIGECKDAEQSSAGTGEQNSKALDETDVRNLRIIADAIPSNRFDVFILISKLGAFSEAEIELAGTLNERYRDRVILLTARELEPYHIFERTAKEFKIDRTAVSADDLAKATSSIYFPGRFDK
jgi:hypothetical protein